MTMGLLDTAEDVGRTLAIDGIAAFAAWIAYKIGADDDGTKSRIMRAAIDAASLEASNRLAAGNLEERMHELAAALEGAFAHLYDAPAHPTVTQLGLDIEYITAEEAARRASIAEIQAHIDAKADLEVLTAKEARAAIARLSDDQDGEG